MQEEHQAQLERQKLDAMKELAYGASHEVNNPLANIAARAQTLLRDEQHPDRRRALEAIHQQAMRAHEMISDLMLFARPPKLNAERVDLWKVVEEVVRPIREKSRQQNIRWDVDAREPKLVICGDRQQLVVAIHAVLTNAVEAIGEDGSVRVMLTSSNSPEGEKATIEVTDSGPGISDEVRPHLFDPFFSGREAGRGLGFGLSKCWRIVTDHGGEVVVGTASHAGATISMILPVAGPDGLGPAE